ncbi:45634_t:CDS:1, partial [Gigaspora margarita]
KPKKRQPQTHTEIQEETAMNSHRDPRRDNYELAQKPKKRQSQTCTKT